MNKKLFLIALVEKDYKRKDIAKLIGRSSSYISNKLRFGGFKANEVRAIQEKLQLSDNEVWNIFYND